MTPRTLATRLIDAWTAECRKPGAHTFEDVAVPLLEEWLPEWAPSEVPVFTARWVKENAHLTYNHFADAINDRLATFRPAPASEPDLERMQSEYLCGRNDCLRDYKGFLTGKEAQSRIDAAVLAEREAIIASMEEEISRCQAAIIQKSQPENHRQSVFQLKCEIAKIRARTTNTEVAGDRAPYLPEPEKEDEAPILSAAGESPAPSRKVVQLVVKPYGGGRHALIGLYDNGDIEEIEEIGWNDL